MIALNPVKDTYIYLDSPDRSRGSSVALYICDAQPDLLDKPYRSLLGFELPFGSNAVINSAILKLYLTISIGQTTGKSVNVHKLTKDFVEGTNQTISTAGATWNDYKIEGSTHYPWDTAGGDYEPEYVSAALPTYGWVEWDITDIVNSIHPASNKVNLMVKFAAEDKGVNYGQAGFGSREVLPAALAPVLELDYLVYGKSFQIQTATGQYRKIITTTSACKNIKIITGR